MANRLGWALPLALAFGCTAGEAAKPGFGGVSASQPWPTVAVTAAAPVNGQVDAGTIPIKGPDPIAMPAISGLRRLSNAELADSISDLVPGVVAKDIVAMLPDESAAPFDNDYLKQVASTSYVDALEAVAAKVAITTLGPSASARGALLGCTPASADDEPCLRSFAATFGRRVLRRTLSTAEIDTFASAKSFAVLAGDFYAGAQIVMRQLLQDPELIFRVELGVPVPLAPGVFKLTPYEMATRLSFTLWGRTPPDWLLDAAEAGKLDTSEQRAAAAARLFADPRGTEHLQRFHALWLGYSSLGTGQLDPDFLTETRALVERVSASEPFGVLLSSKDTFVNARLATHYGLTPPMGGFPATGWAWVPYEKTGRAGVLGQGAVLSNGGRFVDTSPVSRGKFVSERLLCRFIGAPPANVNVDMMPMGTGGSNCKRARYKMHTASPCATCHKQLDPVGFGLERFDRLGAFRTTEPGAPECPIDGQGMLDGHSFVDPAGLAQQLADSDEFKACAVKQVFRYAHGRVESPTDAGLILALTKGFEQSGQHMKALLLAVVGHETFAYRTEEP